MSFDGTDGYAGHARYNNGTDRNIQINAVVGRIQRGDVPAEGLALAESLRPGGTKDERELAEWIYFTVGAEAKYSFAYSLLKSAFVYGKLSDKQKFWAAKLATEKQEERHNGKTGRAVTTA